MFIFAVCARPMFDNAKHNDEQRLSVIQKNVKLKSDMQKTVFTSQWGFSEANGPCCCCKEASVAAL